MSNACACANTTQTRDWRGLGRGVSAGQHMYMRVTDRFGHGPDSTAAKEDLRRAAASSRAWAESILSLWYENQIALLYAKWIDDHRSVRSKEGGRKGGEVHLNWDWIGLPAWSSSSSSCSICEIRLYLWFVNCVLWWCCLWNYYTFTGWVKSVNLPLHLVACKDINNARSGYASLPHSPFQLGAPGCMQDYLALFLWARKCWALKFNCATVQQQQQQQKQVNVKTKQTDGINDDDENKEKKKEEGRGGTGALVPGQKIY